MTARARILAAIDTLEPDELEVVAVVAERLGGVGRRSYGELRIDQDARDFRAEALDEVADALVYSAAGIIRECRQSRERERRARAGYEPAEETDE